MNPNPNFTWTTTFVSALARAGLKSVVISPGSRSTPLTLAFAAHPQITVHLSLDERSAAFFALGLALATDAPVALVCTSGTAAANYYPAIIEANMSQVPLLVLTTDRPPELRHSGANQTIDQVKLYGDHVLWAVDMDVPHADASDVALRNVATTAARAYATANGLRKGAVHINFPFRKPLEPETREEISLQSLAPSVQHAVGVLRPTEAQADWLREVMERYARGLIVCGPRCPGGGFPAAVAALSRASGYPIVADPLSGVRFGPWVGETAVVGGTETLLAGGRDPGWAEPEVIIRFGQVPTSKWLNAYLGRIKPAVRLHVRANGVWADDEHQTTAFWQVDEVALCEMVAGGKLQAAVGWRDEVLRVERPFWERMHRVVGEAFFDGTAVVQLLAALPDGANVVLGNSLPVRHVDQFWRPSAKRLHLYGNRGASGIDGNVSTALGVATADPARPTYLLIGDVTFYHDMNGLLPLYGSKGFENFTVVLLNNGGGGIFNRLPIAQFDPPFTELFLTPHGLDFSHAAALYGLHFSRVADAAALREALAQPPRPRLIEVMTESRRDEARRREIVRWVLDA